VSNKNNPQGNKMQLYVKKGKKDFSTESKISSYAVGPKSTHITLNDGSLVILNNEELEKISKIHQENN